MSRIETRIDVSKLLGSIFVITEKMWFFLCVCVIWVNWSFKGFLTCFNKVLVWNRIENKRCDCILACVKENKSVRNISGFFNNQKLQQQLRHCSCHFLMITCAALHDGRGIRPTGRMRWRKWVIILVIIDLLVGAVLAGLGGQRVVVADRAGQVVHQTQLALHWTLDDQGDRVKLRSPLDKLR